MASVRRSRAGRRAWRRHRRSLLPVLSLVTIAAIAYPVAVFAFLLPDMTNRWYVLLMFVLLGLVVWLEIKRWEDANSKWEAGARGEMRVGRELEKLYKEGFHVFHDYRAEGRGNVDHFLVGEAGVFVVESKAWQGEITSDGENIFVDGKRCFGNPLKQVGGEAKDVRELIQNSCGMSVWVQSILCFCEGELRHYEKVRSVEVASLGSVNRLIMDVSRRNPDERRLSPSQTRVVSRRLQKRLGEQPASAPGMPPDKPNKLRSLLRLDRFFVALYVFFLLALSVVFADATATTLENLAGFYRVFEAAREALL